MDKEDVVAGLSTKSDKIRALNRAGYKRSEIADYIGVRYQFVRNVLVDEERRSGNRAAVSSGLSEDAAPFEDAPRAATPAHEVGRARRIDVAADGTLVLPPELLVAAGIRGRGVLLARFDDDEIKLMTPEATTRKIHSEMRRYIPESASLVDDLILERRREVEREQGDA
jgi:hypothetical protein